MNKIMSAAVVSLALLATACGDSDSSDTTTAPAATEAATDDTTAATEAAAEDTTADAGESSGELQAQVADLTIQGATAAGFTLDEDCVRAATAGLSDADAQLIVDAGLDGNVTVSPEGEALGQQMMTDCVIATPTT